MIGECWPIEKAHETIKLYVIYTIFNFEPPRHSWTAFLVLEKDGTQHQGSSPLAFIWGRNGAKLGVGKPKGLTGTSLLSEDIGSGSCIVKPSGAEVRPRGKGLLN